MDNYYKELIRTAHDVKCPVCGTPASYEFTANGFKTITCCHDEVKALINDFIDRNRDTLRESKNL